MRLPCSQASGAFFVATPTTSPLRINRKTLGIGIDSQLSDKNRNNPSKSMGGYHHLMS